MDISEAISHLRRVHEETPVMLVPPTLQDVTDAEQSLNVRFHPDYHRFLMEASVLTYGSIEPFALHDAAYLSLILNTENAWAHKLPKTLLPFCPDNGNYFCLPASGASSEVVYWDHNGSTDERWSDLAAWIEAVWIGEYEEED